MRKINFVQPVIFGYQNKEEGRNFNEEFQMLYPAISDGVRNLVAGLTGTEKKGTFIELSDFQTSNLFKQDFKISLNIVEETFTSVVYSVTIHDTANKPWPMFPETKAVKVTNPSIGLPHFVGVEEKFVVEKPQVQHSTEVRQQIEQSPVVKQPELFVETPEQKKPDRTDAELLKKVNSALNNTSMTPKTIGDISGVPVMYIYYYRKNEFCDRITRERNLAILQKLEEAIDAGKIKQRVFVTVETAEDFKDKISYLQEHGIDVASKLGYGLGFLNTFGTEACVFTPEECEVLVVKLDKLFEDYKNGKLRAVQTTAKEFKTDVVKVDKAVEESPIDHKKKKLAETIVQTVECLNLQAEILGNNIGVTYSKIRSGNYEEFTYEELKKVSNYLSGLLNARLRAKDSLEKASAEKRVLVAKILEEQKRVKMTTEHFVSALAGKDEKSVIKNIVAGNIELFSLAKAQSVLSRAQTLEIRTPTVSKLAGTPNNFVNATIKTFTPKPVKENKSTENKKEAHVVTLVPEEEQAKLADLIEKLEIKSALQLYRIGKVAVKISQLLISKNFDGINPSVVRTLIGNLEKALEEKVKKDEEEAKENATRNEAINIIRSGYEYCYDHPKLSETEKKILDNKQIQAVMRDEKAVGVRTSNLKFIAEEVLAVFNRLKHIPKVEEVSKETSKQNSNEKSSLKSEIIGKMTKFNKDYIRKAKNEIKERYGRNEAVISGKVTKLCFIENRRRLSLVDNSMQKVSSLLEIPFNILKKVSNFTNPPSNEEQLALYLYLNDNLATLAELENLKD